MNQLNEQLAQDLEEAGSQIMPVLEDLFPRNEVDYLSAPVWHHMQTGGKRIRPALCLMCCEELGAEPDRALNFAAAVELLHNMLLVHDDIEDGDRVRRDEPTVWVKFGVENAINVGDYMLGRAYSLIMDSPLDEHITLQLARAFTRTYEHTCRGQALDMNLRGTTDLSVERYLDMVRLKTGDYLALGMVGGAIIAGAPEEAIDRIRELGKNMGPAFQIRDDVIDLTQGKGRAGAIGNDIKEGKPSILYAHALGKATGEDRQKLIDIANRDRSATTEKHVKWVLALYDELGSLEFAQSTAEQMVEKAFQTIDEIPVDNKDFFRDVAHFMAERTT
ncbi:MAG: polyprenyl synthetase family protein [Planctomycetota bacterium]